MIPYVNEGSGCAVLSTGSTESLSQALTKSLDTPSYSMFLFIFYIVNEY